MAGTSKRDRITVAVTGPTGDIGVPFVRALERSPRVGSIVGMARRPFDAEAAGFKRTEYHQGDVLDRASVDRLVAGADVVVHLAFIIMGDPQESHRVNLEGSRNVFQAAVEAGAKRLVYASSVAAYGFDHHEDGLLEEDHPAEGTDRFYYSAQKAEVESVLTDAIAGSKTDAYVFRPCIVAGPDSLLLVENMPYVAISEKLPAAVSRLLESLPILKPVLPDPGVRFQLVHSDDVATALRAAVLADGPPGTYNLAGEGELTVADLADAMGWYSIPIPELAVDATAAISSHLPFLPPEARWIDAFRTEVLMDTAKARRELKWRPQHDARATLDATVRAAREQGLL